MKAIILFLTITLLLSCGKRDDNSAIETTSKPESIEQAKDVIITEIDNTKIETEITLSGEEIGFIKNASSELSDQLRKNRVYFTNMTINLGKVNSCNHFKEIYRKLEITIYTMTVIEVSEYFSYSTLDSSQPCEPIEKDSKTYIKKGFFTEESLREELIRNYLSTKKYFISKGFDSFSTRINGELPTQRHDSVYFELYARREHNQKHEDMWFLVIDNNLSFIARHYEIDDKGHKLDYKKYKLRGTGSVAEEKFYELAFANGTVEEERDNYIPIF